MKMMTAYHEGQEVETNMLLDAATGLKLFLALLGLG